jgi:hypothetical protein
LIADLYDVKIDTVSVEEEEEDEEEEAEEDVVVAKWIQLM